jgi:hypothetical protein
VGAASLAVGLGVEPQCGGNRAPLWLTYPEVPVPLRQPAINMGPPRFLSQKVQKLLHGVLTVWMCGDYIRLTNEGGSPLATKKFASVPALSEIQESRVSDTRTAPEPKAKRATTLREAVSVL